jgi:hypothetical protein
MAKSAKSPESKSSENAEALLPAKKYEPTAVERPTVDRYFERYNRRPPAMRVTCDDDGAISKIQADHPDVRTGGILMMQSLGTANEHFYKGIISQLVELGSPVLGAGN